MNDLFVIFSIILAAASLVGPVWLARGVAAHLAGSMDADRHICAGLWCTVTTVFAWGLMIIGASMQWLSTQ